MEPKVTRINPNDYDRIVEKAKAEGISMAEATRMMIEEGARPPSICELSQFKSALAKRGLVAPRRPDWVWGVTDVLPADMLEGTKLEAYADARKEAELRCRLGTELYETLVESGELPEPGEYLEAEAAQKAAAEAAELAKVEGVAEGETE